MNKKESLVQLGWDEDLIKAFGDLSEESAELPIYEIDVNERLVGTTEVFVQIQMPMSVTGLLE